MGKKGGVPKEVDVKVGTLGLDGCGASLRPTCLQVHPVSAELQGLWWLTDSLALLLGLSPSAHVGPLGRG